jgi:hypothetical protein
MLASGSGIAPYQICPLIKCAQISIFILSNSEIGHAALQKDKTLRNSAAFPRLTSSPRCAARHGTRTGIEPLFPLRWIEAEVR